MSRNPNWPSRTHRGSLQNALGEAGEILPYLQNATPSMPARGWYARLSSGKLVFLGDSSSTAAVRIERLLERVGAEE